MTQEQCSRERERLSKLAAEYDGCGSELYARLCAESVRRDVCTGSNLHMGYYCPSLILDAVIGNTHRGKLLKRPNKRSKPTHFYYFDARNRLTAIHDAQSDRKVVILRDADQELWVEFSAEENEMTSLSECVYQDGMLVSYARGMLSPLGQEMCEYYRELYQYTNGLLTEAHVVDCIGSIMAERSYHFTHTADGCLSCYTVEEYKNGAVNTAAPWHGHWFEALAKRKI